MLNTKFEKTVFGNGLRVLSEEVPSVRSVSIGFWVDVGSRDETKDINGISHFVEHMVFKGTPTRDALQIAASLESVGGHLNAFTSREQTCYYAKVLDEHLPNAVDVISDIMLNPLLLEEEMAKEKKVVIEEIHDLEDAPSEMIHDIFAATMWGSNSLGLPIMGSETTVNGISRENIVSYMRQNYSPKRVIISACGNLKHDDLLKLIEGGYGSGDNGRKGGHNRQKSIITSGIACQQKDIAQTYVSLGLPIFEFTDPRRNALLILNNILGGGMSSRLFQRVREEAGLVYTIASFMDFNYGEGIMGVYFATSKGQVEKALKLIYEVFDGLKAVSLTDEELYFTKSQLKGNLVLGLESTSNRMNRAARHEILCGRYFSMDETIAAIDKVTSSEVLDVANAILTPDLMNLAALGQVGKPELIPYS